MVLAAALTSCSARPAHSDRVAARPGTERALRVAPVAAVSQQPQQPHGAFQTTRTFRLGGGRVTRTFTFRERAGVILRNRLTARGGARVVVAARLPHVAGATVWSWPKRNDPSASCRPHKGLEVCTQGEEWCPMPSATWQFRLVKLGGPATLVRFDFVVAARPARA
jgi:hypothetical protein